MRDREPVEIVQIAIPLIAEAIAVCLFIAAAAVWLMVLQ
jgi:hypothetical protein